MSARRILLCALTASATLFAVGAVFHFAVPVVAPTIKPQFENLALYRDWDGWTSTYMLVHPLVYGAVFALVFVAVRPLGLVGLRGGLKYGLGVFAVGALPVWLLMYASTQVSPEVMASFVIQSVCQYAAAGAAVGAVAGRFTSPISSR